MGPLPGRIVRLEYTLKELLVELDEIKKMTRSLEQENEMLRRQLTEVYNQRQGLATSDQPPACSPPETTLVRLYREGFHVCNVKFAQTREEECLFCLSLLRRQDGEVEKK